MEKEAAFPNDFPTDGVALRCFLVVSNYTRSLWPLTITVFRVIIVT